jgi:hypothetical protein
LEALEYFNTTIQQINEWINTIMSIRNILKSLS